MDDHLDRPGFKLRVRHALGSCLNRSPDAQYIFASEVMGLLVNGGLAFRIENNLGDPLAIPQINKNDAAVVPSPLDPAHEYHFSANIFRTQLIAMVSSSHISQFISHATSPLFIRY